MTMTDNDNDTICTSELLDLIQADIFGNSSSSNIPPSVADALGASSSSSIRSSSNNNNNNSSNNIRLNQLQHHHHHHDPFRVRLTRRQAVANPISPSSAHSPTSAASSEDCDSSEENDNFEENRPLARNARNEYKTGKKKRSNAGKTTTPSSLFSFLSSQPSLPSSSSASAYNHKRTSTRMSQQRMPFGRGYGGMFHDSSADRTVANQLDSDGEEEETTAGNMAMITDRRSDDNSSSAMSSIFSLTSNLFINQKMKKKRGQNPYSSASSSSHQSINSHAVGASSSSQYSSSWQTKYSTLVGNIPLAYLQLPFQLRYFMQLFAIIAIFMLASLNYFIATEINHAAPSRKNVIPMNSMADSRSYSSHYYHALPEEEEDESILEGGGASPNRIPRLRARDPLKFLHRSVHHHSNELFDRAVAKFKKSVRFGSSSRSSSGGDDGGRIDDYYSPSSSSGPFQYGWKSMPRLITANFATGLSDDETRTNQHANNAEYYQSLMGRIRHGEKVDLGAGGEEEQSLPPKGTVAYVLAITSCYPSIISYSQEGDGDILPSLTTNQPRDSASFRDFAIMLRAMIHAQSYRNSASGSLYDYKMHALLHPHAKKCRDSNDLFTVRTMNDPGDTASIGGGVGTGNSQNGVVDRSVVLQDLGYMVTVQYPPIDPTTIQGSDYLRTYLSTNSDQMNDLIRLYAYQLEEYDAVILVDYDTLILRPIDEVVDLIMESGVESQDDVVEQGDINSNNDGIDAVFSWEHLPSLINPHARASAINLSFFVLRPSKTTFDHLVKSYQTSAFSEGRGWGSIGRGSFPGWMTTQGFLTYYYDEVANAAKVEVNRCSFGNSGEEVNVNNSILITNEGKMDCFGSNDGQCNDCSKSKFDDVVVADLSYCRAPWECGDSGMDGTRVTADNEQDELSSSASDKLLSSGLCRQYQKLWFSGRLQMEDVHPQLQKGKEKLCIDGRYQPMMLVKSTEG